jgi:NADP-dependent 3-hydroxy acid dehydrogenase YdfG
VAKGPERLNEVAAEVSKLNPSVQVLAVPTDMQDEADVTALYTKVKETFGHADVLVNNAGVNNGGPVIHENDTKDWWSNFVSW